MRKYFILLAMLIWAMGVNAQSISDDFINDNQRVIVGKEMTIRKFTDKIVWIFNMYGVQDLSNKNINYFLTININSNEIKDNGVLLIKTFDDKVIKKDMINVESIKRTFVTNGVLYDNINVRNIYHYPISEEDLNLINKGISKIRIETYNGYLEYIYKKDKAGRKLFDLYLMIKEKYGESSKSVYDNF